MPTLEVDMLLRFSAGNHLSFYNRQEISMVATKLKGPSNSGVELEGLENMRVLPAAIVYGANAAGKTSLIRSFQFMRTAILYSHSRGNPEGGIPRVPFLLAPGSSEDPSVFEADFVVEGVRYHYGFEANSEKFVSEWLYSFPDGRRRKLFERNDDHVDFGSTLKGQKRILVDLMRKNSLFLATATQNDHEYLSKIVDFFRKCTFSSSISVAKTTINSTFKKDEIDDRAIDFLKRIGTGVISYRKEEVDVPDAVKRLSQDFLSITRKHFGEAISEDDMPMPGNTEIKVELAHSGVGGKEYYFPIDIESSGTRRLLIVLNKVFKSLDSGTLLMVDELDASLHTLAAEAIVSLFCNPETNRFGAQLIATTHDTNLMGSSVLRRDQIWFVEKDEIGASHLFPLSDIRIRQTDDFEQGYLQGRYGAIPFSGSVAKILVD